MSRFQSKFCRWMTKMRGYLWKSKGKIREIMDCKINSQACKWSCKILTSWRGWTRNWTIRSESKKTKFPSWTSSKAASLPWTKILKPNLTCERKDQIPWLKNCSKTSCRFKNSKNKSKIWTKSHLYTYQIQNATNPNSYKSPKSKKCSNSNCATQTKKIKITSLNSTASKTPSKTKTTKSKLWKQTLSETHPR